MNQKIIAAWAKPHEASTDGGDDDEGTIEPRYILIERLEESDKVLGEFINHLVFSPIGVDDEGKTV